MRKNAAKYIPLIGMQQAKQHTHTHFFLSIFSSYDERFVFQVPQILAMMVDLDDDPDWSVQDEIEDEDEERLTRR